MSASWCRVTALAGVAALALTGAGNAAAATLTASATVGTASAVQLADAPADPNATRSVDYRGVHLSVPTDWAVIDLDVDPTRCVRLDVKAVYVGRPSSQQDCPAHVVGRAETIWLHPGSDPTTVATASNATALGTLKAHTGSNPVAHTKVARFTAQDVQVDAVWGDRESTVDDVLATATAGSTKTTRTAPTRSTATSTAATASPAPASAGTAAASTTVATATGPHTYSGMGFDTCAAPSIATMQAWMTSPYRAAGIYIGGSMRACGDGNLTPSWVSQVSSMGWGLIPIYVGPQAPCVNQTGLATIDPTQVANQGRAAAADAAGRAAFFGLGAGTPIYYDMEAYDSQVAGCTTTVLTFLTAWTQELHARGYTSGAYGSTASLMVDLSKAVGTTGFTAPDNVWFANWNGLQTVSDSAKYPEFRDGYWANGQRLHQYGTGSETWGGVKIDIDANWVGGRVTGNPVPIDYGANTFGPGSPSFVFTGDMYYWKPNAGQGLQGRTYSTYANGSTEENGATWSPSLSAGLYAVSAYVPATRADAKVTYAVSDARGSATTVVDQSTTPASWAPLGTYLARSGTSVRVHAGDSGPSPTSAQVGVDAMRFTLVASAPSAPTSVSAVPDNGRATVRWSAATANGSPVTSYTLTASPSGATTTVSGSTTSANITGLRNETAYTFTVKATNVVGTGPASTRLGRGPAVVLVAPGPGGADPDPRHALRHHGPTRSEPPSPPAPPSPSRSPAPPARPSPPGATAAAINLTATAPQRPGFLSADSSATTGSSTANFAAGQTVANLLVGRLSLGRHPDDRQPLHRHRPRRRRRHRLPHDRAARRTSGPPPPPPACSTRATAPGPTQSEPPSPPAPPSPSRSPAPPARPSPPERPPPRST